MIFCIAFVVWGRHPILVTYVCDVIPLRLSCSVQSSERFRNRSIHWPAPICKITHWCATWLIDVRHTLFVDAWHDSFMCEMIHWWVMASQGGTPPKKPLKREFSAPYTFFWLICTIRSELTYFLFFTHLSKPGLISAGFQCTGSTSARFQEAVRAVWNHTLRYDMNHSCATWFNHKHSGIAM